MFVSEQKRAYWEYQYRLAKEYLIPLFAEWNVPITDKLVLDLGCAEGGILCACAEVGASGVGIEINLNRLLIAKQLAQKSHLDNIKFISADFYNLPLKLECLAFNLILLRDVLEHLPDKRKVMSKLMNLMHPNSLLFITFPPYYAPFGGHQQMLKSWLKRVPYFHTLPSPFWTLFRWYIKKFDKNSDFLKEMDKIRKNKILINKFINLATGHGFKIVKQRLYILRPSYRLRFGWPVLLANRLARIPVLREFLISGAFFLLQKE